MCEIAIDTVYTKTHFTVFTDIPGLLLFFHIHGFTWLNLPRFTLLPE